MPSQVLTLVDGHGRTMRVRSEREVAHWAELGWKLQQPATDAATDAAPDPTPPTALAEDTPNEGA